MKINNYDIIETVKMQLKKMGIVCESLSKIRLKDGIGVYRVHCNGSSYIIKYFENESYRREIEYYNILQLLELQTIELIAKTDCALLLEDIEQSETYRLGVECDLNNPSLAIAIAQWYKKLHTKGKKYILKYSNSFYSENDCITPANLHNISSYTNTTDNPVWTYIGTHLEKINHIIENCQKTIVYNDFYYTNLIVKKDVSSAFMYDYNLLGKGYAYADIRNVTYSLGDVAKQSFLQEYGDFSIEEVLVDNVIGVLAALHTACRYKKKPQWAIQYVEQIEKGTFSHNVERLISQ